MRQKQVSKTELLISFDSYDERARFMQARKFTYTPGGGCQARWLSKAGAGDPTHQLEMVPARAEHCDNLQALDMRINRYLA